MTETASVAYSVDAGVATITLDRPGASNSLNRAMKTELLQALSAARGDASVRAVAITATGKNFCVGQDLAEHVEALRADPSHAMDTVRDHYNPVMRAMNAIEVPVVVAVNGACVGAGLGLALAGDIRIAGSRSRFGTAFTGIGLASDSALSASLPRLIGASRATAMFLLGDTIDAATALDMGTGTPGGRRRHRHPGGVRTCQPPCRRAHRCIRVGQGADQRKRHRALAGHPRTRSSGAAAPRRLNRPRRCRGGVPG